MTEPAKHKIYVFKRPPLGSWIVRVVTTITLQIGVIGVGIIAESDAMQWAGFVVLMFIVIISVILGAEPKCLTIAEARKRLDEIEGEVTD